MCPAPKIPNMEVKNPAPPPPSPEESAAQRQGAPESYHRIRSRVTSNQRNRLRIDRDKPRNANVPRYS